MSQSYASAGITDPIEEWPDWTPTYNTFTLGNGTVIAHFIETDSGLVVARLNLTFGSTTTIDGTDPRFSMPVVARSDYVFNDRLGVADLIDSGNEAYLGTVRVWDTDEFVVEAQNASGTYNHHAPLTASVPFTWGDGDAISFLAIYEPA